MHRNAPHLLTAQGISRHLPNAVWSKLLSAHGRTQVCAARVSEFFLACGRARRPPEDARAGPEKAAGSFWYLTACAAVRQLGDVGGDPPGLVAGEQVCRRAPPRLVLEIDVSERLPVGVADDEAGVRFLGEPGEAARRIVLLLSKSVTTRRIVDAVRCGKWRSGVRAGARPLRYQARLAMLAAGAGCLIAGGTLRFSRRNYAHASNAKA
jgi:hypothetical protein